ncbi:hypothetical protein LVT45_20110, partial [Klebsiella quasipneumoniae subsp. quasipneumoniae]|nr:hypothetical protein [Klebsiella quasipneumoniae subsp. quasipneumoniae]
KSAQIREILISESAWEEMTCLFAPSLACMTNVGELLIRNDCGITPVQNRKMSFFILLAPHRGFIDAINGSG